MAEKKAEEKSAPKARAGFNSEGKAYPGVDPETGERITVTLEALKKEFGSKRGEKLFEEIRDAVSQNPRPITRGVIDERDIQISGEPDEVKARISEILSAKE